MQALFWVLSYGFKAKLSQNHRIETSQWADSVHTTRNGSQHAAPTADSLLPRPMNSAFTFWHGCQFLGLPSTLPMSTDEFGSMARDPGAQCMFSRMRSKGLLSKGSVECQSISWIRALCSWIQRCWYHGKTEGINPLPTSIRSSKWHARWRNQSFIFIAFLHCSNLGSSHDAIMQERLSLCFTSDKGALPLCLLKQML